MSVAAAAPRDTRPTLFLSPAGEPFHADAGKPYPVSDWFAEADTNHDGKLTLAEFAGREEKFFARLDRDNNGVITRDEMASSRKGYRSGSRSDSTRL